MKRFLSSELAIIILSIAMYAIVGTLSIKVKSFGDLDFHTEAVRIANCLRAGESCHDVSLNKAPLPSVFYAIPYTTLPVGSSDNAYWITAMIWSALFITISLILMYWATINFFNDKIAGVIFIGLSLIIPLHVYYGLGVLAEGPAYIAVSLAVYGWSIFNKNIMRGVICYSLGIILLILARPNAILILPILFTVSAFLWWRRMDDFRIHKLLTLVSVAMGISVLVVFSVVKLLPGNKIASQESYLLHVAQHGRYQFRGETWDWRFWDDNIRGDSKDYQQSQHTKAKLDSLINSGEGSYDKVYSAWLLDDVISNPVTTLKQFLVRIIYGHTLTINSITKDRFSLGPLHGPTGYYLLIGGLNVLNWSLIFLALYALFLVRNKWPVVLPIIILWLALVVFSAALYMEQRYLFPIRPVILLLASGSLLHIFRALRLRLYPNTKH